MRFTKPTMKEEILEILQDGRWHGCRDFIYLGLSYRNRLNELKHDGYPIVSEREEGKTTFRYKLLKDGLVNRLVEAQEERIRKEEEEKKMIPTTLF